MKFSIKDFFSKCDFTEEVLNMENFIFRAVLYNPDLEVELCATQHIPYDTIIPFSHDNVKTCFQN